MPELGATIALAHYLSSFLVGVIFRFYGRGSDSVSKKETMYSSGNMIYKAFKALYKARQEDGRPIGKLLGDSVKASMNTILLIGGFIILFSVFLRILTVVGITELMTGFFESALTLMGFSTNLAPAMVSGFFEIDLGTMAVSQADAPLNQKVVMAGAIIAWSGLCVHGQVASIVIESGIRMTPYIIARFLHAVLAAILTFFFFEYAQIFTKLISVPEFSVPVMYNLAQPDSLYFWVARLEQVGYQLLLILGALIAVSITIHIINGLYSHVKR